MALTKFDKDLDIIVKLDDEPNDVGGLGAPQFKAEFDKAGNIIKDYINKTLIPEVESDIDKAAQGIGTGGGINGNTILNKTIPDSKIINLDGAKIDDGSIATEKHAKKSITRELLAEDATTLQTEDFPNKVVPGRALADQSVGTTKLEDGAMIASKVNETYRTQYFPVAIPATAWTGDAFPYVQSVAVDGLLDEDRAKVYFDAPDELDAIEAQREAFGLLYKQESDIGTSTFYATEKPEVDINVILEVHRI